MHERDRWRAILQALSGRRVVTVRDLEAPLKASPATIRRDLRQLEMQGKLRRVHGGAELIEPPGSHQLVGQELFDLARKKSAEEKRAIGRRAASMCAPGDSIIIDGGTTTYMMVEFLHDRSLQILTSSFPIADALIKQGDMRVLVSGGEIYREQQVILSPYDDSITTKFSAAKMFVGAQAVTSLGLMQTDPILIQSEQRLMKCAEQVIALVDSSKFGRTGGLILCPLTDVDLVITDDGAPKSAIDMLRDAGVKVVTVAASDRSASAA